MAELHLAAQDFTGGRPNTLGLSGWAPLAASCDGALNTIQPGLEARVTAELAHLTENWPHDLAQSVIHADLFPDNVLMLGDAVTGLIDFYFSCTDIRAYDVAITHSAWSFSPDGADFHSDVAHALIAGYRQSHGLTDAEYAALPVLSRGAALRFLLTRAYDWINTPSTALVTRKDPLAYLRRLDAYAEGSAQAMFGPRA
jgi:homoserine kinase type II